jgi:hypothetical protein
MTTTYVSIAADLDANFKPFYFVKVGKTEGKPIDRCDKQRLKFIWGASNPWTCYEGWMKAQAKAMFGRTDFGYKPAGATESYGQFETPSEALRAAWALLRRFRSSNVVGRGKANFRALPVNESRLAFELRRADFEAQQAA